MYGLAHQAAQQGVPYFGIPEGDRNPKARQGAVLRAKLAAARLQLPWHADGSRTGAAPGRPLPSRYSWLVQLAKQEPLGPIPNPAQLAGTSKLPIASLPYFLSQEPPWGFALARKLARSRHAGKSGESRPLRGPIALRAAVGSSVAKI